MFAKNKGLTRRLLITALVLLMVVTTAATFAYWKTGIEGNHSYKNDLVIKIGEGNAVESTVTLANATNTGAGKTLVPVGRSTNADQLEEVVFEIDVLWALLLNPGDNLTLTDDGALSVVCTAINIDGTGKNYLTDTAIGGEDLLFDVSISHAGTIIGKADPQLGADSVKVTARVKLSEPADRAQYLEIAGKNFHFTFRFSVESSYNQGLN